jgi:hypothetical protein
MRLIPSEQENLKFEIIKPYLKLDGLRYVLDEEKAPSNVKKTYEEFLEIREKALHDALVDNCLI